MRCCWCAARAWREVLFGVGAMFSGFEMEDGGGRRELIGGGREGIEKASIMLAW